MLVHRHRRFLNRRPHGDVLRSNGPYEYSDEYYRNQESSGGREGLATNAE